MATLMVLYLVFYFSKAICVGGIYHDYDPRTDCKAMFSDHARECKR